MLSEDKFVTAQDVADALSMSVETIWRYTREKRIPYVEIGHRQYRYPKQAVLAALTRNSKSVCEEQTKYGAQRGFTYDDYAKLPEEPGFQYEVIAGVLIREPTPSYIHQRVSRRLQRVLEDYWAEKDPDGEVFAAPLDVWLSEGTIVQPDLFYLPSSRPPQHMPVDSLPELVVEILSPSTIRKDRVTKLSCYQVAEIPHYWIVDPNDGVIEAYELRDVHYVSMVRAFQGTFVHPSFPGLSFDIEVLFA